MFALSSHHYALRHLTEGKGEGKEQQVPPGDRRGFRLYPFIICQWECQAFSSWGIESTVYEYLLCISAMLGENVKCYYISAFRIYVVTAVLKWENDYFQISLLPFVCMRLKIKHFIPENCWFFKYWYFLSDSRQSSHPSDSVHCNKLKVSPSRWLRKYFISSHFQKPGREKGRFYSLYSERLIKDDTLISCSSPFHVLND